MTARGVAEHRGGRRAARDAPERGARRICTASRSCSRKGALPAEIPFGHPNFLWPCWACGRRDDRWLSIYAVDLARSADGRWWVLADRTQAPSGPGLCARKSADRAPRRSRISRNRWTCGRWARSSPRCATELLRGAGEDPLAVVLTPGSFNETYFEHAYLARQLGFPLVEGHDLTVRDETRLSEDARGPEARARHPAQARR